MKIQQLLVICITVLLMVFMVCCVVEINIKSDVTYLKAENAKYERRVDDLEFLNRHWILEAKKHQQQYAELITKLEGKLGKCDTVVDKLLQTPLSELRKMVEGK